MGVKLWKWKTALLIICLAVTTLKAIEYYRDLEWCERDLQIQVEKSSDEHLNDQKNMEKWTPSQYIDNLNDDYKRLRDELVDCKSKNKKNLEELKEFVDEIKKINKNHINEVRELIEEKSQIKDKHLQEIREMESKHKSEIQKLHNTHTEELRKRDKERHEICTQQYESCKQDMLKKQEEMKKEHELMMRSQNEKAKDNINWMKDKLNQADLAYKSCIAERAKRDRECQQIVNKYSRCESDLEHCKSKTCVGLKFS